MLSLTLARKNYPEIGASEKSYLSNVRPPMPDEK